MQCEFRIFTFKNYSSAAVGSVATTLIADIIIHITKFNKQHSNYYGKLGGKHSRLGLDLRTSLH